MEELQEKWEEIKEFLRIEYEIIGVTYKTFINPLSIHSVEGNTINILVPNEISNGSGGTGFIERRYSIPLKVCIAEKTGKEYNLNFLSEKEINNNNSSYINEDKDIINENENRNRVRAEQANLNPKYTFDTFVVGNNNALTHSAALRVSEEPGRDYNPLFIWGGSGLGKTHLMHSIGHHIIKQNPDMNVLYVTSENFTNEVIESIKIGNQAMAKLREKYRKIDVLLLDDVQFLIGKQSTQEEFFNTFNALHSAGKQIVLTSDKPPKDIEVLEERIKSRFLWGLISEISKPNYETRMAILRKNGEIANFEIDDEIYQYIANNVKSNVRELEGAFKKVLALSNLNRDKKITLSVAKEAIRDIVTPNEEKKLTADLIIETVSNFYAISVDDIKSSKRNHEIVIPRQITMYLCNDIINMNYKSVGKFLGDRDHSTVIHGINKIVSEYENNEEIADAINKIKKLLNP